MNTVCRRLLILVSMAIAAILIAGCGDDKASNERPLELEETLGFSREGILERQTRVEGRIRDCMKAQGFDYVPVDPFAQQQALTGKARLTDDEFTKQFGFGITTLFGRGSTQSDPNEKIRSGLSATDRAAYNRTLGGENPSVTFTEAVDAGDFTELGGCTKTASEAVFGGAAVLTTLVERLDGLDERIAQDQRVVRSVEEWSACMRDAGYQYEEPDEIDGDLEERFQRIVGVGVRPGATAPPDPGTSYDKAALTALQREEVKVANADLACENKHIRPVEEVVRPQYEKTFRQDNQRLLARVRPLGN